MYGFGDWAWGFRGLGILVQILKKLGYFGVKVGFGLLA